MTALYAGAAVERQPDTLLDRELDEDVRRLQVDHAGFVDNDPIARRQHVPSWSVVYGARAGIDFARSKPGPLLRAALMGAHWSPWSESRA
ncbi:hypothetical protein GCM10022219_15010 [Microbacterium oryzae]|uniref:hypothetical protein n=1 Tax=Microbacterium oryzae TaxID=743009 RepID=UPI0012E3187F|nr:hypothetical protein [Microbacterium oryzae]